MKLTDSVNGAVFAFMREAADRFILPRHLKLTNADVVEKAAKDFVTIADRESETFLGEHLPSLLPGSIAIGEESVYRVPSLKESMSDEVVWLIDPLDGTRNFVEGRPDFAVMVSLLERGDTTAAWIYFPLADALVETHRGEGTTINGSRIVFDSIDRTAAMTGAMFRPNVPEDHLERLDAGLEAVGGHFVERFSAGVECLEMLKGGLDFGYYWTTMPWDHAPCSLAIREAGGRYLRLDGTDYRPDDDKTGVISARSSEIADTLIAWLNLETEPMRTAPHPA